MADVAPTAVHWDIDIEQFREKLAREGVLQCLNVPVMKMKLFQKGLIPDSKMSSKIVIEPWDLIQMVERFGLRGYKELYWCVKEEKSHLGHRYVEAELENREYMSAREMTESRTLRKNLRSNLSDLANCDIKKLLDTMYSKGLLTDQELRDISSMSTLTSTDDMLGDIISTLAQKGPLAYSIFAECVYSVDPDTHKAVFKEHKRSLVLRPNMAPSKLKLQGCLKGKVYDSIMRTFQECHHNGEWGRLESEADKFMTPDTPKELQAVATLERAISHLFRREERETVVLVDKAWELCAKIDGHNSIILRGRGEYILSRLYRYLQRPDKAREHVRNARDQLWMVEPGEDMGFLFYCDACVELENLGDTTSKSNLEKVKMLYENAIDQARRHESGLELVEPHSLMRLAQMYLGSTHYSRGSQTDIQQISQASNCLKEVKQSCLPLRSQCHYLIIETDLRLCQGDSSSAKLSAQTALELALENKFTTEIISARERIACL